MYKGGTNYHRRSVRLREYDYGQSGWYYVTVCTFGRQPLFGQIKNGVMVLNELGKVVMECWYTLPKHFENVKLDMFVVMPNHFHGIVVITDNVGARHAVPESRCDDAPRARHAVPLQPNEFGKPTNGSLSTIIRSFKSASTKRINQLRDALANPVWQRNFYDHIIRNEQSLAKIRKYIHNNPANWLNDEENY